MEREGEEEVDVDEKDEGNIHVNAQKALMNVLEGCLPLCSGRSGHRLVLVL